MKKIYSFDNNYHRNNNYKRNNTDIKSTNLEKKFKYCPKIGLDNIVATCYMNETLQCFCHIKKFVEFFKYKNNTKNKKFLA